MGKKHRRNKDKKQKKNPPTSILTVTQSKRSDTLELVSICISKQKYKNILEWIVIDTTNCEELHESIVNVIEKARKLNNMPEIKLIKYPITEPRAIGGMRNFSNKQVSGDIIVCMDDDDYYPPTRVSHAVESLVKSKKLIAGSSETVIYDVSLQVLFRYPFRHHNHSVNNCFAYKKEYLEKHSYDETKTFAEETSFTNKFTEPMVQLVPKMSVIQMSHPANTYDKKPDIYRSYYQNPNLKGKITEVDEEMKKFIPDTDFFMRYCGVLQPPPEETPYDIVYYAHEPIKNFKWDPTKSQVSESKNALIELSKAFVRKGKKVAVYACVDDIVIDGVEFIDFKKFPIRDKFKTLILWDYYSTWPMLRFEPKADKIILDMYNVIDPIKDIKYLKDNMHWHLKSNFHHGVMKYLLKDNLKNVSVIPSGIEVEDYTKPSFNIPERNPHRICYTGSQAITLLPTLMITFPYIRSQIPDAEIHIYTKLQFNTKELNDKCMELLSGEGVVDHTLGGTMEYTREDIIKEKYFSTFQLYFAAKTAEMDCVDIRNTALTGCLPIISKEGVFSERPGIHIEDPVSNPQSFYKMGMIVVELMKHPDKIEELRDSLAKSKLVDDWDKTAEKWLQ